MKRKTLFIGLAILFVMPIIASAANLVPCGGPTEESCQLCHFVTLLENITNWFVVIMSVVVAIIFVSAGLKLVTSAGNVSAKSEAKTMITNAFIGFVILLSAWLIVDFGMKSLVGGGTLTIGPWNSISCVLQPEYTSITGSRGLANGGTVSESCTPVTATTFDCSAAEASCLSGGGTSVVDTSDPADHKVNCTYPTASYSGSCSEVTDPSNPCSAANLTMFGSRAAEASIICNKESNGSAVKSTLDLCCGTDGDCTGAQSFSGGYFQINVLAHSDKIPGCTGTFYQPNGSAGPQGDCMRRGPEGSNTAGMCTGWTCEITDTTMFNTCMKVTTDKDLNFEIAEKLYSSKGSSFRDWSWSATKCGIPY